MRREEDWGWWRRHVDAAQGPPADLAPVMADWMEHHGHPVWAAWFRDGNALTREQRLDRFFGALDRFWRPDANGPRVLVGAIPVAAPATRFVGPWFETLHVIGASTSDEPDLAEVLDAPCLPWVHTLVVHGETAGRLGAGPPEATPPLDLAALAPIAHQLRGLWVMDGALVGDLTPLPALTCLSAGLGEADWHHPGLRELYTRVAPRFGRIDLPALRHLDIETWGRTDDTGDVARLLAQLPSVETLEIDGPLVATVAQARANGHLPHLARLRVWGDAADAPPNIQVERQASWTRSDIRVTSDWVFDRALRVSGLRATAP